MLIILDRDGVINEDSDQYIKSPEEWLPIPGSLEAIAKLKKQGFTVVIATNQSGIARGLYTEETLTQIHYKMSRLLQEYGEGVDGIYYCPHHPEQHCSCRKPAPGLFLAIAKDLGISLENVICIGDSLRDIQAAQAVSAKPMLVLTGNGRKTLTQLQDASIPVYQDLAAAVADILQNL